MDGVRKTNVLVSRFLEAGGESLAMELVAGESGLNRAIGEAALNRPGLALSGFFEYFANKRIQVIGWAEHAFLTSLSQAERKKRIEGLFAQKIPCVVISRSKKVFPEIIELAEERKVAIFRTSMITKHYVNAATILMENLMAPHIKVQGTMVEIMGIGVMVEGKPGMGKSEAALGLVRRGHALVSDDITALRLDSSGNIIASPVEVTRYHMEIRGLGIIHVPSLFGVASVREEKRLDLVATLCEAGTRDEEDRSGERLAKREFLGVSVPQLFLPVAPGRDLTNLVETAALDFKLRRLGHDAVKELDERLMRMMSGGKAGSE